jgi:hypothetical protein
MSRPASARAAFVSIGVAGFTRSVDGRPESPTEPPLKLWSRIHPFALLPAEKHALIHVPARRSLGEGGVGGEHRKETTCEPRE